MKTSNSVPWYDNKWLNRYIAAKEIIKQRAPNRIDDFEQKINLLRTNLDFNVIELDSILDETKLLKIKGLVKSLKFDKSDKKEMITFGRLLKRNIQYFNTLQEQYCNKVSDWVGEEVEPCYNFLSLYKTLGICPVHMDAPTAKWTVDICIDQSKVWPIHFSNIIPWPENGDNFGQDWEENIKEKYEFKSYELIPGKAIIFSGSAQFHYRDRIYDGNKNDYCNLVFLHYRPKDTGDFINPDDWAKYFQIHALKELKPYWSL